MKFIKYLALSLLVTVNAWGQPIGAAPGTNAALYPTVATKAAGDIAATYATYLTNVKPIRMLDIVNKTDCDIWISLNASTNHFLVPAYSALYLNYQEMMKYEANNVSGKYVANTCTTGTVYISGVY